MKNSVENHAFVGAKKDSQQMRLLTSAAIFAAMIMVMTAYIGHVPDGINGGYIHFGDSLIYVAACLLPTPYALAAAAIGGGLADLLTAPVWTLPTIIIKMLIALPFTSRKGRIVNVHNIAAAILAFFISGFGYYIANVFFMGGFSGGLLAYMLGGSLIQSCGSAIVFVIFGLFLDKMGFKKKFLKD
ncbi:MAG: TIGR04002 family protein [Muribaculaceae bacterium]|nr:TIGR04002 family protein [Roseburia sp.]MCM1429925.1 TIGR04002 family protein [Muribaculaceae bacterium]MCM1493048.1 TIGR04002 family protein [Muribaculaceae bacterium]